MADKCLVFTAVAVISILGMIETNTVMSNRTVVNEVYKGLVEQFAIPAEVHERDGKKYASFGSVVPIHVCTPEEVAQCAGATHHYCDVFTEQVLAPLGELAYVRVDDTTAEKVFINRSKRILITSSDARLALWRAAPTFESSNRYLAGAPVVDQRGALVTVVTARRGNHYAVSTFEGEGGYFETSNPWKIVESNGGLVYGDRTFPTREELREYVASLPPAEVGPACPPTPVLHREAGRVVLLAQNGRQLAHQYLHGVITTDIEYL